MDAATWCVCKLDHAEVNTQLHDHRLSIQEIFFFPDSHRASVEFCLQATSSKWIFFFPSTSILFHPSFTCEMQKMAAKGVNNRFPWLC